MAKRKVHRAFVEELPIGHPDNHEGAPAVRAFCEELSDDGGCANTTIATNELLAPGCKSPIERSVFYLSLRCRDADHVL